MPLEPKAKKVVDAVGLYCPEPVFMLRKALDEVDMGHLIDFMADDPGAEEDVKRLTTRRGDRILKLEKDGKVIRLQIEKVK